MPEDQRVGTDAAPPTARRSWPWPTRSDALLLAGLAAVLRLPALLASAHLTFDDGVYGASAVAMRHGALPFRDVFSSQGPLYLPLVRVADVLGGQSSQAPRLLPMLSGIAATVLCVLLGRRLGDRNAGLLAGALMATSGSFVWVSSAIHSDSPAITLGLGALLAALRFAERPSLGRAVAVGVLIGAAISTKSVALPFAVPIGLVLLASRRWALASAAVVTSGIVAVGCALPFGLDRVIDQAFTYHTEAAEGREPARNISKIVSTLVDRDPVLLALGAVAIAVAVLARTRGDASAATEAPDAGAGGQPRWASPAALLWSWTATTLALLLYIHPLWRPHLSHLIAPLALLVAIHRPPARMLALGVLLVPLQLAHVRTVVLPQPYDGNEAFIVEQLRALPDDALVISDEPGLVWRSGHRTPDDLVDTSSLRVNAGRITPASLAHDAAEPDVCAVVVTSSRFGDFLTLPEDLAAAGYDLAAVGYDSDPISDEYVPPVLYVRAGGRCAPPAG